MPTEQRTLEPYVARAIDKDGSLVAAEFIEGLDPDKLIEAIARWTGQGCEFRIKKVASTTRSRLISGCTSIMTESHSTDG